MSEQLVAVAAELSEEEKVGLEEVDVEAAAPSRLRPKKVDIDKMHTYRDAIRGKDQRTYIRSAFIVYPGATIGFPADRPLVGALAARPGNEAIQASFRSQLDRLLDEITLDAP